MHEILVQLRASGVGILVTDHNMRETLSLCDRVYIVSAGRVIATGSPAVVIENPEVRRHFLGDSFEFVSTETGETNHEAAGRGLQPAAR